MGMIGLFAFQLSTSVLSLKAGWSLTFGKMHIMNSKWLLVYVSLELTTQFLLY